MENQNYQKWVNVTYLAVSALVGYIVFAMMLKIVGVYDLEARVRNAELIIRVVSLALGAGLFLGLIRSARANQFMSEVVVELTRVTWPTSKETTSATGIVIVMVLISGMVLGLLDYIWTQLLQWIL